jgi:hypothetical protein
MGEEADELLRHRFETVNVWLPIRGPLRDAPLAVCDATSIAFTDFVSSEPAIATGRARSIGCATRQPLVLSARNAGWRGDPDQIL